MTETSGLWTTSGTPSGHQVASYTQALASIMWEIASACSGFEGVAPSYLNELECTDGGANTVDVDTGGAIVDGKWYKNDAVENVNIPSAVGGGNTRIDRIVIRATWANFEAVITRIAGTDAASPVAPSITQTSGTTYDIQLCQVLVDTSGNVTVTDERTWAQGDDNSLATGAVTTAKIATGAVTLAKMAANSVDSDQYVDGSIDFAHLAAGASKVTNRQGGDSSAWATFGSTDYTPTSARFQVGVGVIAVSTGQATASTAITFPAAFSNTPVVLISPVTTLSGSPWNSYDIDRLYAHSVAASGFTMLVDLGTSTGGATNFPVSWLAIGPE